MDSQVHWPFVSLELLHDNLLFHRHVPVMSEETKLPQPLRISVAADMEAGDRFAPDTPLSRSKNYMDLKHAMTDALPKDQHFTLIEAVADHIADTIFLQDKRILRVAIEIVKLAISENGEEIGITMVRNKS